MRILSRGGLSGGGGGRRLAEAWWIGPLQKDIRRDRKRRKQKMQCVQKKPETIFRDARARPRRAAADPAAGADPAAIGRCVACTDFARARARVPELDRIRSHVSPQLAARFLGRQVGEKRLQGGALPSIRIGGDVTEWLKVRPC